MFLFKPQAKKDLQELLEYLAKRDKKVSGKVKDSVVKTCKLLDKNHQIGAVINHSLVDGIRYLTVIKYDNYIIFYQTKDKQIEIIRISHHSRNWIELLH